jgi:glycosyltransferase involved in cell wall biosynthesis
MIEKVAAFMVVKNGYSLGYPFLEAIRCVLPFVDQFWVSDGYSQDGTLEYLQQLASNHPIVQVLQHAWPTNRPSGFAIGDVTNMLMDELREMPFAWLWYVQADELWRPESAYAVRHRIYGTMGDSITVNFLHLQKNFQELQFPPGKESYRQAIRIVRNLPYIQAHRDAWTFEGCRDMVYARDATVVHANSTWWEHWAAKARSHADNLYQDLPFYKVSAEEREAEMAQAGEVPELWTRTVSPFDEQLPEWIKDTVGWPRYQVRDEVLR